MIASIYRPPDAPLSSFEAMISSIQSCITHANSTKHHNTVLTGDFKFPAISWDSISSSSLTASALQLINFLQENFLPQYILSRTRFNNILDLVLSDLDRLIHHMEVQPTELSDHNIIRVTLPFNPAAASHPEREPPWFDPSTFRSFYIHKGDYDLINTQLKNTDWDSFQRMAAPPQTSLTCSTVVSSIPALSTCQPRLLPLLPSASRQDFEEP